MNAAGYLVLGGLGVGVLVLARRKPQTPAEIRAAKARERERARQRKIDERERIREERHAETTRVTFQRQFDRETARRNKANAAARKAREKADRQAEKARALEARASTARSPSKAAAIQAKADTASRKADQYAAWEREIESGDYTHLADLMASGQARIKNPGGDLVTAKRESARAHGDSREILVLDESERHLPKYLVDIGRAPEISYVPDRHSSRHGGIWDHEVGDRGDILPIKSPGEQHYGFDPRTGRVALVSVGSAMKWDLKDERGIVG